MISQKCCYRQQNPEKFLCHLLRILLKISFSAHTQSVRPDFPSPEHLICHYSQNFLETPNIPLQFDNFLVKSVQEITLLNTCVILAWAVKAEKKSRFSPTQVRYFNFVVECLSRLVGSALSGLVKADKLYATSQFRSAGN